MMCSNGEPPPEDSSHSEEVCLLHDAQKFFLVHLTISIAVCLVDHFLKLLICHTLAELLGHTLEILERDFASFIIVEQTESLEDFILWITVEDLVRHHLQELFVLNRAASIIVNVGNHLLDLLLLWLETKRTHGHLELFRVN